MKNLRKSFERFCLKNRYKGIANLMLYIAIGNLITYVLSVIDPSKVVYSYLCFSRNAILHGQVWRLFSYIFTYLIDFGGYSVLLGVVSLFCYYSFGKILEQYWGVCRFNLYYLFGVLITDVAALLIGGFTTASALNLSLFLAVATIAPNAQVLLFFIIPVKFKYMAWVYLGLTAYDVISRLIATPFLSLFWLMPLVPLANYFLFFGEQVMVLFPQKVHHTTQAPKQKPNPNWASGYQSKSGERPYRHKCTVCGKTDTEYPSMEFRYCSKCNGYYCYCIDHIQNHAHIE